jgi:carotenoid cleavage dioxygenase
LDDRSVEFPRINPSLVGKSNQYAYALASSNLIEPDFKEIVKYDFKNDTSEVYEYGPGKFGAEPVFVAAEGTKSEDEGYLLSLVYNQETDKSDLIILNAKEPKSGPLATVHLPQRVPHGFHGEWIKI